MRILHVAWEYPPLVYGGLGRHIGALSKAQAALGHDVTVVTQGGEGQEFVDGVRVIRIPSTPFPYSLPDLLTWVGELDNRLGRACTTRQADIVHAHDWMVARAATTAAQHLDVPMVATVHATEAGRHSGYLPDVVSQSVHLVEQWLVDEADAVIVCSRSMAREVEQAHARTPAFVIPNGIDAIDFTPTAHISQSLRMGSPRLTFVGRIEWEKGVFIAIRAMPEVLHHHSSAVLRIVGTGSQSEAVAELVAQLRIGENVQVLGHVDEHTLREVYSSTDLLLAPSSYEPFGIVALEGAAMGLPLVVGDTGGLAEFVTDDRGRRFPPGDSAALTREILAALADPADTTKRAESAHAALTDYRWDIIAAQTVAAYDATGRRPRPPRQLSVADRQIW